MLYVHGGSQCWWYVWLSVPCISCCMSLCPGTCSRRTASTSSDCFHGWYISLRPGRNRRPFADDIFKCIFLNENEWILRRISLKFVPKVLINNIPSLVQIMACRRPGDKPLSEPMGVSLLTHICVTRPQWVKVFIPASICLYEYRYRYSMRCSMHDIA